jgi:hypothetical protein
MHICKYWKKSRSPPTMGGGLLNPQTMKRSNLLPELSKTVYFTPGGFGRRVATVTIELL